MSATGSGRGFTLIEVVAAAALLGIAVTGLLEGFTRGMAYLPALRDRQELALETANAAVLYATGTVVGGGGRGSAAEVWWQWEAGRGAGSEAGPVGEPGRVVAVRTRGGRRETFTLLTWAGSRR